MSLQLLQNIRQCALTLVRYSRAIITCTYFSLSGSYQTKVALVGKEIFAIDNIISQETHPHFRIAGHGLIDNWLAGNENQYAAYIQNHYSIIWSNVRGFFF